MMRILSRRDIVSSLITGLTTGAITWGILSYLGRHLPFGIPSGALVVIVPVAWVVGVKLGYALGVWYRPFIQFGKFACIGFANAAVDFGVLYLGIALTGGTSGVAYILLKSFSFAVAVIHSYVWNKTWAFEASRSQGGSREAASFVGVALAGLLVNVTAAALVVAVHPAGFEPRAWAGVGAVTGSAAALIFSFIGFRVFVFRRK